MKKRAGIYNRCSTEEEAQVNALDIQAEESREIVIRLGWQVAEQYIESQSGTGVEKRREYQRLLQDMEKDKFDVIVIKSIDRLMRSVKDWYLFLDKLTQNHKQLYIYIDNKFYTPQDSLLTGIKAILAEDFSRELSKKIKNAHKRRQEKKSGVNITRPMFGWDRVGRDAFVVNEMEAEAYRLAFALAREGKGFYSIANILYEKGVRSKSGIRISDVQWRKMLYSPRAHGTMILHTTEYDFETKKKIKLPQEEWIYVENALPPIVSEKYQQEVLKVLESRRTQDGMTAKGSRTRTKNKRSEGLYELSGKVYCGNCGQVYYRIRSGAKDKKISEWKCSTVLKRGRKKCHNINVTEEGIYEAIEKSDKLQCVCLSDEKDTIMEDVLSMIKKMLMEKNGERAYEIQQKELEKLQKKKGFLLQKYMDGIIDDEDYQKANREMRGKINLCRERLDGMKGWRKAYINREEYLSKIKEALQQRLIRRAETKTWISKVDKIVVYPDGRLKLVFDESTEITVFYTCKTRTARKREQMNYEILQMFRENPSITLKQVSERAGMSSSYISTSVRQLKENGFLRYERCGNTHTGRWIVTEQNKC